MACNLFYLSIILDNTAWKEKAVGLLRSLSELIIKYPTSFGNWACLLIDLVAGINEIAICCNGFQNLRDELNMHFIPNKVLQCTDNPKEQNKYPLLAQKEISSKPLIYLCRNYTCKQPVEIRSIISEIDNNLAFN